MVNPVHGAAKWQVLEEDVTTNPGCGPVTVTASQYVWGLGYIDDLVLRDDDSSSGNLGKASSGLGRRIYVLQDANYNVTALTDTSGNVLERLMYDPYGSITVLTASWGGTTDAYGWEYFWQGGRYDTTTQLYNFRFRDYDPALAAWTEQDPAGYVNGPDVYQMELSNPVTGWDPFGLEDRVWGFNNEALDDTAVRFRGGYNGQQWRGDLARREMEQNLERARRGAAQNGRDFGRAAAQSLTFGIYEDPCPNKAAHRAVFWLMLLPAMVFGPEAEGGALADEGAELVDAAEGAEDAAATADEAAAAPKEVNVDPERYPESAKHLEDAGATDRPLPVNRADAAANRADALKDEPGVPGMDRDEAPPAVLRNPGDPVSVRPVTPADNRGAGSSIGYQIRGVPDGGRVIIRTNPGGG